jgi:RTX calcium-binding nonapeptide repeat (4 copies)
MKRRRTLELAALLTGLLIFIFPASGAGELKPDTISPAHYSGSSPRIDSDGSGDVIAVWRELNDDEAAIRAAFRPKGGSFGESERISTAAAAAESPELAMDKLGNAVAVWQQSTNGRDSIVEAAYRPANGAWSAPQALSDPAEPAFNPDVAIAYGHVTAVWVARENWRPVIRTESRTMTDDWSAVQTISGPAGPMYTPSIALDDHGGAVATWLWGDGANRLVQAAVRSTDGTWSPAEQLSGPGRDASQPVVAIDGDGNALVGWIRGNGIWTAAQTAARPAGGDWGPPRNLSRRGRNAGSIELTMNRRGDAMVSWLQGNGLVTAFQPKGEKSWKRAAVTGYWYALRDKIALDEAGNATAVWGGDYAVSASYKPEGQAWQDDYLLSGYDTDSSSVTPAVTAQAPGNAMAIWVSEDESDDHIQVVGYDKDTSAREHEDEGDDDCGDDDDCGGDDDCEDDDCGDTIQGTAHADVLVGTPGNDVFYARGGNDVIVGRGGRDIVHGGPGNDVIVGGPGSDRLFGGSGRDRLLGGRGNDLLQGNAGRDVLRGNTGDDTLRTHDRNRDWAFGGSGLDQYDLDRWLDRVRSIESRV